MIGARDGGPARRARTPQGSQKPALFLLTVEKAVKNSQRQMNRRIRGTRNGFQYNYSKKTSTIVEFDIVIEGGKRVAKNITFTSNWRVYYGNNPQIISNSKGEYGFSENGVFMTNGDIQQMIKRIFQIVVDEDKD